MVDIDAKKTYNIRQIVTLGVLGKADKTVLFRVLEDQAGANTLKTVVVPGIGKHGKRYQIKGTNIIRYLKSQYEST